MIINACIHVCIYVEKWAAQQILRGFEGFDQYYGKLFGERWDNLLKCMITKNKSIAFVNPFFNRFEIKPNQFHPRGQWCKDTELNGCMYVRGILITFGIYV